LPAFEPIAIIGRGCVLPGGALNPKKLWDLVIAGTDVVSGSPDGYWRTDPSLVWADDWRNCDDLTWTDRGGYVTGFERVFDSSGFAIPATELEDLDPLWHWVFYSAREALRDAGYDVTAKHDELWAREAGIVLGNLSYPTASFSELADSVLLDKQRSFLNARSREIAGLRRPHPWNRFMSGLPSMLLARGLRFGGPAFSVDAACASSLYAIKLACERLQDREANLMLAGGVNRVDSLAIHIGFCALQAMSRSGQSRPFHREADGLLPSEGAGFVVLRRLSDALRDDDRILGVIRGVGVSNDGRGRGMLSPSEAGQRQAMEQAYRMSGLQPADVSLIECHATGTPVGDATEIRSMSSVYGRAEIPVGSLKSNLGHLITASGIAGLIKVLSAMEAGIRPPTIHCDDPLDEIANTSFRLLRTPEPWIAARKPFCSAVNNFGFGGNNAHLVVEQWEPRPKVTAKFSPATPSARIAVVALEVMAAGGTGTADFVEDLVSARSRVREQGDIGPGAYYDSVRLSTESLHFLPLDLEQTLPQQLLVLEAAKRALKSMPLPARDRVGVFAGMQCDPAIARYGSRWRMAHWARLLAESEGEDISDSWVEGARESVAPLHRAGGVLGSMANMVANRLSYQFDLAGPSLSFSAEEHSGLMALEAAGRALRNHDIDIAIVAAVDLCCDVLHRAVALELWKDSRSVPGDAAVVMVLQREDDPQLQGQNILAFLDTAPATLTLDEGVRMRALFGHPHACVGLLQAAACVTACQLGFVPEGIAGQNTLVMGHEAVIETIVESMTGTLRSVRFSRAGETPLIAAAVGDSEFREYLAHREINAFPAFPEMRTMQPAPALPMAEAETQLLLAPGPGTESHQRLISVHNEFVSLQNQVHRLFLASQHRILARLTGEQSNGTALVAAGPPRASMQPEASPESSRIQFSRTQLETIATGRISEVFGPRFRPQDDYPRRTRLPAPPLLFIDQVVELSAKPDSTGQGTIRTETVIQQDSWYLHQDHMPASVLSECTQGDLILISWLGADFESRGDRAYRLLSCDLTYFDRLPCPGDTVQCEVSVTGNIRAGSVSLFSFHADCRVNGKVLLSLQNCQAGLFTEEELSTSRGIIRGPSADAGVAASPPAYPVISSYRSFSRGQVRAFSEGRSLECFGPGFERAQTHTRTPRIPAGKLLRIEEVSAFDPEGGTWKLGYLKAECSIHPEDWYFKAHFKDDPCMPGFMICEGCFQGMAFLMSATGFTLQRDGWQFEPESGKTGNLQWRGQVSPRVRNLGFEIHAEEWTSGAEPSLVADVTVSADGHPILHGRHFAIALKADWPLSRALMAGIRKNPDSVAAVVRDIRFDRGSLLAWAIGKPSDAFGPFLHQFDDGHSYLGRIPGPPLLLTSRISRVHGEMGVMKAGAWVESEYDVPEDAWYFEENDCGTMPLCILLECAYQPCGWLSLYLGGPLQSKEPLHFRNIEGKATLRRPVTPDSGLLRARATLLQVSHIEDVFLLAFEVEIRCGSDVVLQMQATLGYFTPRVLASQAGFSAEGGIRFPDRVSGFNVDLTKFPERYVTGPLRLPVGMLRLIDRVTDFWPDGGPSGLGSLSGERSITSSDWFFRAHFLHDPIMPGSFGLEAAFQLLQFFIIEKDLAEKIPNARFRPALPDHPVSWKFAGEISPAHSRMSIEMNILRIAQEQESISVAAEAWIRADGTRVYKLTNLCLRVIAADETRRQEARAEFEEVLDPTTRPWLQDHRPTHTLPVVPMMSIAAWVARVAARFVQENEFGGKKHASDWVVTSIEGMELRGWLTCEATRRMRWTAKIAEKQAKETALTRVCLDIELAVWRSATVKDLERFETITSGRVWLSREYSDPPVAWLVPPESQVRPDPYESAELFHGPAFQLVRELRISHVGTSALLDAGAGSVPSDLLHESLLDACLQTVLSEDFPLFAPEIDGKHLAFPFRLDSLRLYTCLPNKGILRCETRFAGFQMGPRFPSFQTQLIQGERVLAEINLTRVLVPLAGHELPPRVRRAYIRDHAFVAGAGLSTFASGCTRLQIADVQRMDWIRGSVAHCYRTRGVESVALAFEVAVKEHVAQRIKVHPRWIELRDEEASGRFRALFASGEIEVLAYREGDEITVVDMKPT
jgi:3-oxoacyl-(acyl-carrier-protein) synthase/3-hydroxymyristoyl/3-hydroxydecanoyl-(acyl carrier protein) dehydratase